MTDPDGARVSGRNAAAWWIVRLKPRDFRGWWRRSVVENLDHRIILERIASEGGWSPRYAFMTLTSAGIAVLGLLLSSPAVVIGAMLISPLMNPIISLGFSLATLDFAQTRRSLRALALGSLLAVGFTATIVLASPLKEATTEILSRTRPNLFDLMVALFAALAGVYAAIRGGAGTVVGVAIATALMPPLAVIGYGLATGNVPVYTGAATLYATNFVTIALSAAIMARLHGFGPSLSVHQTLLQSTLIIAVFVAFATPLAISLDRIAGEAVVVSQTRAFLSRALGPEARVTQLSTDFEAKPMTVHAVALVPHVSRRSLANLEAALQRKIGRRATLQLDQVVLSRAGDNLAAQQAGLAAAHLPKTTLDTAAESRQIAQEIGLAAGLPADSVTVDPAGRRVTALQSALSGADLATYRALEQRVVAALPGWRVFLVPPVSPLPAIRFPAGSDTLDPADRVAVDTAAWAAKRWNVVAIGVPGAPAAGAPVPRREALARRRGRAVATVLRAAGLGVVPEPPARSPLRLTICTAATSPCT
jgi:uncharacterized hydrophobic protein (TIGR00271 family)